MEHISTYLERYKVNSPYEIRQLKDGDWYWIGKKILRIHARSLKPSGLAVYNVLASFANAKTQACYPTHRTIGKIAGMSKRTVSQKMRQLESLGLIRREKQKGQSIYYLLDIRQMRKMILPGEKSDP